MIVVSDDGQTVHPVAVSGPGQDLKITLPQPATLVVHYDIPGDVAQADFNLTLHSNEMEMPLWKYATVKATARVTNGGQMVLSNLIPATLIEQNLPHSNPKTHFVANLNWILWNNFKHRLYRT